jgi:rod shape determining protein RodA
MLFVGGADVSHLISIILIATIALLVPRSSHTVSGWAPRIQFSPGFFKDVHRIMIVSGVLICIAAITFVVHHFSLKKYLRRIYIPCAVLSLGLFSSVIIQNFFKLYQKKRILVFLNPDLDPHSSGYNIIQSKIAVGSGGFFGKGFLHGSQAQLGFLPERTSDFAFSVFARSGASWAPW